MYKDINVLNIISGKYKIDEYGHIYSTYRNRELCSCPDKDGYLHVMLCTNERIGCNNKNHKRKSFHVHTLVMLLFNGPAPSNIIDPTVDHIDYNKLNNHYTNLRWLERSENTKFRKVTPIGERNGSAVLTEQQVIEICELLCTGMASSTDIAKMYHTNKCTIANIRRKKNWKHISAKYNFAPPCNSANNRIHYYERLGGLNNK